MTDQLSFDGLAMTPAERKRMRRRAAETPRGHAWKPGTGPEGETCRTCAHIRKITYAKSFHKCALVAEMWTHSRRTDIRAGDPACRKWERGAAA